VAVKPCPPKEDIKTLICKNMLAITNIIGTWTSPSCNCICKLTTTWWFRCYIGSSIAITPYL